jgi:hypothetical protein
VSKALEINQITKGTPMESIHDLAPEIQKRLSEIGRNLNKRGVSKPETKNMSALVRGLIQTRQVMVMPVVRVLGEKIAPKKTWERLTRNMGKEGLWERLLSAHREEQWGVIRKMPYCIIDLSDIQKHYAEKMEGLGRVRDGSKKGEKKEPVIGNGYYWLNAVMANKKEICPVHGEIYSVDKEGHEQESENKKILRIIDHVYGINSEAIFVIDRGGDRITLERPLLEGKKRFIIRGQGQRSLRLHTDSEKLTNIGEIARRTRVTRRYVSERGKKVEFDVGIRKIYLGKEILWLVVSRQADKKEGLSWYLTDIKGTKKQVMDTVMEAYGLRWRIEEYHRQIKQDFKLEEICIRKYAAIKTLGVLVMMAAAFCARLPYELVIKLMAVTNQLPHKRLSDIPNFPYYKIESAVATVLNATVRRPHLHLKIRKRNYFQLELCLGVF